MKRHFWDRREMADSLRSQHPSTRFLCLLSPACLPSIAIVPNHSSMKTIAGIAFLAFTLPFAASPAGPTAPFQVAARGRDYAVWQRVTYFTNQHGRILTRTNGYTELETGKHYLADGQWRESRPEIFIARGGAVATNIPHKVAFAANIRSPVSVAVATPANRTLKIRPLGLAYYDFHSEDQVLIAELKDSIGHIVGTNQVWYRNAFSNLLADVRYTVKNSGIEQDVIIRERPPLPEAYGLNPRTTRLLMLTEFIDPPADVQPVRHVRRGWRDATVDKVVKLGGMSIGPGTAFSLGQDRKAGVPVQKQWAVLSGRTFLIEEVPFPRIVRHLRNLQAAAQPPATNTPAKRLLASKELVLPPAQTASAEMLQRFDASTLLLPPPAQTAGSSMVQPSNALAPQLLPTIQVASVPPTSQGFVLDADLVSSSNVTLQGDTTYLVDGTVNVDHLVIEGGTVLKYTPGASLNVVNSVECLTGPYRPAIFTALDDNTVGETLGSGTPSGTYASCAISLGTGGALKHLTFRYAADAVYCANNSYSVRNAQFLSCNCALHSEYADFYAGNLLIYQATNAFYGSYFNGRVEHLTCHQTDLLVDDWDFYFDPECHAATASSTLTLVNSITACTARSTYQWGDLLVAPVIICDHVQDFPYDAGVFQASGAGNHYLPGNSPCRAAGTATIDPGLLASLARKTTSPPVALDTDLSVTDRLSLSPQVSRYSGNAPDLGYYYDPLDYTVQNLYCKGAAITVAPGTAIGVRNEPTGNDYVWPAGFILWENSSFVSHGTPENPNVFTDVRMVQELSSGWPATIAFVPDFVVQNAQLWWYDGLCPDLPPLLTFRFSTFSLGPEDIVLASGYWAPNGQFLPLPTRGVNDSGTFILQQNSSMHWSLRDCAMHGGWILVGLPYRAGWSTFPPGALSWVNTSFDRVRALIRPTDYPPYLDIDWPFQAYNNLFRGGLLGLCPAPSSAGDWVIKDNLFDSVDLLQYDPSPAPRAPIDHGYNAYYQTSRLEPNSNSGYDSTHDQMLTSPPFYQLSTYGDYYLGADCPLYPQLHATGSRPRNQAGLNHYTSWTDQSLDLATAPVNIGLHYVATVDGAPISTFLSSEGLPDYIADADGNAELDSAQTRPPPTRMQPVTQANNDIFVANQGNNLLPVLANDACSQGFPLTIFFPVSAVPTPTHHGTVRLADDGTSLLYTPTASFAGWDNFTYAIVNDFDQQCSAAVSVYVNPDGTPPTAPNRSFTLTSSDTDRNWDICTGADLHIALLGTPRLGTVQVVSPSNPGTIRYIRPAAVAGADSFPYVLTDSAGRAAVGIITITREIGTIHPPVALSYSTTALRNTPLTLSLTGPDEDHDLLTYPVIQPPEHGQLTGSAPLITYTPNPGFIGMDSISYQAFDGSLLSAPARISIKVQSGNNAPQADDADYQTAQHTPVSVPLYAWDLDDDFLTYEVTTSPAHGSLSGDAPNLTYTPEAGYEGDDSFVFRVSDGKVTSGSATVRLKVTRQQIVTLSDPQDNFTFKGNITYYVTAPITLSGTTTIEGGAVVKFAWHFSNWAEHRPRLTFTGPINCLTTPYRPAIFTARDDDTVGAVLPDSWSWWGLGYDISGAYADVALEVANTCGSDLKYLRIAWANTAIRYTGAITTPPADTVRHVQIFRCHTAFDINGNAAASPPVCRELSLQNCLVASTSLGLVFTGSVWHAQAEHLTVNGCNTLAPDPASHTFTIAFTNCIFGTLNSLLDGEPTTPPCLTGDYNGFLPDCATLGGEHEFIDNSAAPFAPNPASNPERMANFQAGHYLRDGSPFIGVGTPDITLSLKADLAQATTTVPEVFTTDVTSSQTLGPTIPRGTDVPSLGYHYPVIDYVLNGATVNNCTLNIDQGTILAYTGYECEWGLRLNPGARLNVNGYPTNRVVFARLAAIQENPQPGYQWENGPLITFKGVFLPSGTMVSPLPEAKVLYADFPTLAGNAVHLGPLQAGQDQTYDCVGSLAFDGCHFQGGTFGYESGGPAGRALSFRNTIFERSFIELRDHAAPHGDSAEELNVANNLFYDCDMWLVPASTSGSGWAFRDNIFDNSVFNGAGPAAINTHNAYVNMTGHHLSGTESGAVDLGTLDYQPGPLGRFYLPAGATSLLGAGSRSAADAGLYHFTSLADNTKQAAEQVNIGPAYLALDPNGNPFDSNSGGPDGVPDFVADPNGDGNETADEMHWFTMSSSDFSITYPIEGGTVNGITTIKVNLGENASRIKWIKAAVDGHTLAALPAVINPSRSVAEVQLDTKRLADALPHTLCVRGALSNAPDDIVVATGVRTFYAANEIRYPEWQDQAELSMTAILETSSTLPNYSLHYFNQDYARVSIPSAVSSAHGVTVGGIIACSDTPVNLGFSSDEGLDIYSVVELSSTDGAARTAWTLPGKRKLPQFPDLGRWVVSFEDAAVDYKLDKDTGTAWVPIFDPPVLGSVAGTWCHDQQLFGWLCCGPLSGSPTLCAYPSGSFSQTWPIRTTQGDTKQWSDTRKLLSYLTHKSARNFYGDGHGSNLGFMTIITRDLKKITHRYRFVFLDGCLTSDDDMLSAFGADSFELAHDPLPIGYYIHNKRPAAFLSWKTTVPQCLNLASPLPNGMEYQLYAALCHWHEVLTFYWTMMNYSLEEAVAQANLLAMRPASSPPVQNLTAQDPNGNTVPFSTVDCLECHGYAGLGFFEYNSQGDTYPWWP
jgi:hypothetical protein